MVRVPAGLAFVALAPQSDQNRKLASLVRDNGRVCIRTFLTRMLFTPEQRDLLLQTRCDSNSNGSGIATGSAASALRLDPINRVSYLESRCYMLNTLLRDSDFMSMSQGLELRVPLIDHHLAKAVLALPGPWKLNGTPKKLLVEALGGSLPDEIVHRPKRGLRCLSSIGCARNFALKSSRVLVESRIAMVLSRQCSSGNEVQSSLEGFLRGNVFVVASVVSVCAATLV